jgi:hypothetical protein
MFFFIMLNFTIDFDTLLIGAESEAPRVEINSPVKRICI